MAFDGKLLSEVLEIGCAELLRDGRLVELFPEWSDERFPLYAVYPSRLHRAAKVRAFIEFCLAIMRGQSGGFLPAKTPAAPSTLKKWVHHPQLAVDGLSVLEVLGVQHLRAHDQCRRDQH
jgi:hypothetical protein